MFCCQVTFDDRFKSKTFDATDGPYGLQYTFTLQDAVTDCDEWMVPKSSFAELAEEYGLELVEWRNFHEFVHGKLGSGNENENEGGAMPKPGEIQGGKGAAHALWRQSMGGKGVKDATLSEDEWEAAYLYTVFAFRKAGAATAAAAAILNRPTPPKPVGLTSGDVLVLEGAA